MDTGRTKYFRQQVAECERKSAAARTEETRRAWLIAAREWKKMADREELKYLDAQMATLSPREEFMGLEDSIRELAAANPRPKSG